MRFWTFLLLFSALPGQIFGDESPISRLESLAEKLKSHDVWETSYTQEYIPAGMDIGEEVSGRLFLAWPDRALFLQEDPEERTMGLSGRHVRLVDLAAGSCDEHTLSDEEWQRIPLVAILQTRDALEYFSILENEEGVIVLLPREKGGVERVELKLSPDHLPEDLKIIDPQGALSEFHFSGWREGRTPEHWLPNPPEGIQCLDDDTRPAPNR